MNRSTLGCCLLVLSFAQPVEAHHNPRSTPIVTLEDSAYEVYVDVSSADFDAPEAAGDWRALSLSVNLAPMPWLSIHATSGMSRVLYSSGFMREALGLRTVSGVTDTSVDVGARLWRDSKGKQALSIGLGLEVPTGDVDLRLGGGHYAMTGRVVYENQVAEKFVLSAEAMASGNLGEPVNHDHLYNDSDAHLHGAIIAPHGEVQAGGRIGLSYRDHAGWISANMLVTAYLKKPRALGPVALRLGAGLNVGDEGFTVTGAVTVPFAGLMPNLWLGQVGIGYRFGVEPSEAAVTGCGCAI